MSSQKQSSQVVPYTQRPQYTVEVDGLQPRASENDPPPFYVVYTGNVCGAWQNYHPNIVKIRAINKTFCIKVDSWVEAEWTMENNMSFRELGKYFNVIAPGYNVLMSFIAAAQGNRTLESLLIRLFNGWDNVIIGQELRKAIDLADRNYLIPICSYEQRLGITAHTSPSLSDIAMLSQLSLPGETQSQSSQASQHSSHSSSPSPTPARRAGTGRKSFYSSLTFLNSSPSKRGVSSKNTAKSSLAADTHLPSALRHHAVKGDVKQCLKVIDETASMGTHYQVDVIDTLMHELSQRRAQVILGIDCEAEETVHGDDDEYDEGYGHAGPSGHR
ncbi:hypothetical protein FRC08_002385 [Ceratobasidium sp. 394]|nr:hypothetical protein FRC08_002385 [Ceratobasidium sp. 394]